MKNWLAPTLFPTLFVLTLIMTTCGLIETAHAQIIRSNHPVIICPAEPGDNALPDFTDNTCQQGSAIDIDPQNKDIWVKLHLSIDQSLLDSDKPLGFFIRGKTASQVYINGHLLGNNGQPSHNAKTERPGNMDAVYYVEKSWLIDDNNALVMHMSAHHGFLTLKSPIHWLEFDHYHNPSAGMLQHYWPSLLPFGAFVVAALYFGILTVQNNKRRSLIFLATMATFAAGQLLLEVSRGLTAYVYPFHEWRLVLILSCSLGFGLSLFAHTAIKFMPNKALMSTVILSSLTTSTVFFMPGFDLKTLVAIVLPTLCGIVVSAHAVIKHQKQAGFFTAILLLFAVVFFVDAADFLDTNFYYLVAMLMLLLFTQQALDHASEKKIREKEKARADRLQLIIDQNQQKKQPGTLTINGTGSIDKAPIDQIAYGKAAGDYVELVMLDGKTILHHGSLKKLQQDLPAFFLKVHRSYLVNTTHIQSLKRHNTGTGELRLNNDHNIPVSRRIMPQVREQLV